MRLKLLFAVPVEITCSRTASNHMQNIHIVYLMSRFTNSDFYPSHLTLQQSLRVSIAMHMHPSQMEATTAAKECVPQGWEQGGGCNRYLLPDCWNVLGGKCRLFLILLLRLKQKLEETHKQKNTNQPTKKKNSTKKPLQPNKIISIEEK